MSKGKDLTGQRFGKLLVLKECDYEFSSEGKKLHTKWLCKCDCGDEREVLTGNLVREYRGTRSCRKCGHNGFMDEDRTPENIPYYTKWKSMLARCYGKNSLVNNPTYKGCTVSPEWLVFSNFKSWMETQDWEGKQLDKDILVKGNKVYSPETCCFVSSKVNLFLIERGNGRGLYPLGVSWCTEKQKYYSCVNFNKKSKSLGKYFTEEEAHIVWKYAKYRMSLILAERETNIKIKEALSSRYYDERFETLITKEQIERVETHLKEM